MQSIKLMFLGFLVMLVGMSWLYSLGTALPGDATHTINPLVAASYSDTICVNTSPTSITCSGDTDPAGHLSQIVRDQEGWAFFIIIAGLGIAVVGFFFRQRTPAAPTPPSQPSDEG